MSDRIQILSATVENFGSYRQAHYSLAELGLALVEGRNLDDPKTPSNGSGKSTLFLDAPTWCLFGEGRQSIGADDVVNDGHGKECVATVRLRVPGAGPVTVQRFRKVKGRHGLRLWVGAYVSGLSEADAEQHKGFEVTSLDASDTQAKIIDLLGLDLEVWRAAVYRAQDDEERFAEIGDARQKDLLTRVFKLDVVDRWREEATAEAARLEQALSQLRGERDRIAATLAELGIADLEAEHAAWDADRAQRLAILDAELAALAADWQAAKEGENRRRELQRVHAALRANPPAAPVLEPLPPRPAKFDAREPAPPQPQQPQPFARLPLPAPTPWVPRDLSGLEAELKTADEYRNSLLFTIRDHLKRASELRTIAQSMSQRREGVCSECGARLTPEHADREAALRYADAHQFERVAVDLQVGSLTKAEAAVTRVTGDLAQARLGEEQRRQQEGAAYQAALAKVQTENDQRARDAAATAQRAYEQARAAWELEVAGLRQRRSAEEAAQEQAWAAAHAAITARNAEAIVRARGDYDVRLATLEAEISGMAGVEAALERISAAGKSKRTQRAALEGATSPALAAIQQRQARAQALRSDLARVEQEQAALEAALKVADFWVEGFGPKGVKGWMLDERTQELTDRTNSWLRILTGGVYWVRFETQSATQKGKALEKFSCRVFRHRREGGVVERKWHGWSGGQRGRIGVAIDLSLADTIAARASRSYDLLVLDEVFRGLDAGGREAMLDALQELRKTRGSVVVIDHDSQFKAAFERRIVVELQNGVSRIVEAV